MALEFHLEVVTPQKGIYSGSVVSVTAPGTEGSFQVLANHAPLLATLGSGKIRIDLADKSQQTFTVEGGFFEVSNNRAMVIVESAA
jgi:F-type H+-transporting ATPase subunit epsilon